MNFQRDYTDFFDIHSYQIFQQTQFLNDFVVGMSELLVEDFNVDEVRAAVIARTVAGTMLVPGVHYHTPIHVLSMLQFAEQHEIELLTTEKLAIFFHDAIYVPGSSCNEESSILLMKGLMTPFTGQGVINEVAHLIDGTARHLEYNVAPGQKMVMDLDLCGLVFKNQESIIECLEKEMEPRKEFLKKLVDKDFAFRTEQFKTFEETAMLNALSQLA